MKLFLCASIFVSVSTAFQSRDMIEGRLLGKRAESSTLRARRKSTTPENNNNDDDDNDATAKQAALDGVLNRIERSYGRGAISRLGDAPQMQVKCVSTGSLTLDVATGGGYPRGRVVEIYGPESSGKTTLALHAIAECQAAGGTAAFIDAEHALDPAYAAAIGVDIDALLVTQPDSGEMALDVVDQLVRSAAVDLIVVDSVAALVPRAELEGDMGDAQIGLQARLMSKALRKICGSLATSQCTVLFLNQLRSKVGVLYGSPEVTSGGNALKFYASVRLDTRRKETLPDNAGIRVKVKVVKNKIAAPFAVVLLDVLFNKGIDKLGSLLDAAVDTEILERRGSYYAWQDNNIAQGRVKAMQWLEDNPEACDEIQAQVRAHLMGGGNEKESDTVLSESVQQLEDAMVDEEEEEEEVYLE